MTNNNSTYKRLGDYIEQRREKNKGFDVPIRGVSKEGFIPPKQQDADVNLYNVFYKNDFVFNPARMELNSIALNEDLEQGICSSLYEIFYIKDTNVLDPLYLNLLIKTDHFTRFCEFVGWGSVREYCRFADISEYYIEVPPIEEQHKIVSHFNAIRTRIANNKQTIAKLEEAAQALYRKMFVDGIDVENLPEGWRMGTIGDLFELQRGFDLPSQNRTIGTFPICASTGITQFHNEYKVKAPGVVTGRSGSIGEVFYMTEDFWPLNTTLWVKDFKISSPYFVYYKLKELDLAKTIGGYAAVPTLNRNDVHSMESIIPSSDSMIEFQEKVNAIHGLCEFHKKENEKLTEMLSVVMA